MTEKRCTECGCLLVYQEEKEAGLCCTCLCGVPEYDAQDLTAILHLIGDDK